MDKCKHEPITDWIPHIDFYECPLCGEYLWIHDLYEILLDQEERDGTR
jgi:hypothetical protein